VKPAGESIDIGRVLDDGKWGGYQIFLVLLTALAIIFDGIDNQMIGISVPTMMREWGLPRSAFAMVISAGYFGMMLGGAIAGIVGDRLGRRVALLASMVIFGAMTMATSYVNGVGALAVLRFLTGIGLGGAIPNAAALAAEYVPRRQRPLAVTLTIVCVPFGAMLAGLIAIPAMPVIGWRGLFLIGGIVPVVAALIYLRLLPESPRFLARHPNRHPELVRSLKRMGHDVPADSVFIDRTETAVAGGSIRSLFQPPFRGDTIALWTSFFSCLLAVYLGFSWIPSLLTGVGFTQGVASSGITAFNLGGVLGALTGGVCIAWFGSRVAMLTMTGAAVVSAGVMSLMDITSLSAVTPIIVMLAITGALINGVQTTMYALGAHVYPSAIRATGVGAAVSFGRIGAVLSGYAGAWALESAGSFSYFLVIAGAMAVCWIGLASVKRHIGGPQG
jgi:AAHS family 4-hydroxybenzoate transporter-like MFS transporter